MSQPDPKPNQNPHIADLVISDIRHRKEEGLKKYGTPLQPFNGRDAMQDAYEEILDLTQYMRQAMLEQESSAKSYLASGMLEQHFLSSYNEIASQVHDWAKRKGFWEEGQDRNDGEMLALMHSEISEALEALRLGNPPDDKIPEFSGVEAELADVIIRIMDYSHARGLRVAEAIIAKMAYNETRERKHGKQF